MNNLINTKKTYKEKAEAQYEIFEAKVKELQAKAKNASSDVKINLEEKLRDLEMSLNESRAQMKKIDENNEGNFENFKDKLEGIFYGIKEKLKNN